MRRTISLAFLLSIHILPAYSDDRPGGSKKPAAIDDKYNAIDDKYKAIKAMKQIGLGLANFHDVYNHYPSIHGRAEYKGRLSWRVHILPYMGESELYEKFNIDEPWDGPTNKPLIKKMPDIYKPADAKLAADGKTRFVAVVGKETTFTPDAKPISINHVADGLRNTVNVVEADDKHAAVWTKADDWEVDLKKPTAGLYLRPDDQYMMLYLDGRVDYVDKSNDPKAIAALFTRAGMESAKIK